MTPTENTTFNDQNFELAYPEGVENNYWSIARNFVIARALRKAGLSGGVILEVGCGKGIVVAALREKIINCWGVELADIKPVERAAPYVFSHTEAAALQGEFRKKVDTIMFLDVLEHIPDPKSFVKNLLPSYPNVRNLIITLPARNEIWSNYDEFYGHFCRYDLKEARQLAEGIGFLVSRCGYFFHLLYLAARVHTLFFSTRSVKITSPKGIAKPVHRIIGSLFKMESLLLPAPWFGTSILCVASKE